MKQRKETFLEEAFTVQTIISVYHGLELQHQQVNGVQEETNGVMYDFWQLFYMEQGSYCFRIEGCAPQQLHAGELLICEPRKSRFSYSHDGGVVGIINIRCNSPKMQSLKNRLFHLSAENQKLICKILESGISIFQAVPHEAPFFGQQPMRGTRDCQLQMLKNRIELLLISLFDNSAAEAELRQLPLFSEGQHERKAAVVVDYMKAHLHEALSVEDVCGATGIPVSTLKRIFHRNYGCGVIHYFLNLKIREACRLLLETDLRITEISERLGFSSIHYFSKIFKRFVGEAPSQYAMRFQKTVKPER